jgi:hypothetical protein
VVEKRRILLHVPDQIFHKSTLEMVYSDLIVLINRGGLPTRLFNQQLLNELNEQGQQQIEHIGDNSSKTNSAHKGGHGVSSTEWKQREGISRDLRKYLHVIFSADHHTIRKFQVSKVLAKDLIKC